MVVQDFLTASVQNKELQDELYYHIGKKLFENHDDLLSEYIRMRAKVIKKQFMGMKASENTELHQKAAHLEKIYCRFIKEADDYDKGF